MPIWGAARDRIRYRRPTRCKPAGALATIHASAGIGRSVRIAGHENIALIRSGQEWTETEGKERELYLKKHGGLCCSRE